MSGIGQNEDAIHSAITTLKSLQERAVAAVTAHGNAGQNIMGPQTFSGVAAVANLSTTEHIVSVGQKVYNGFQQTIDALSGGVAKSSDTQDQNSTKLKGVSVNLPHGTLV